MNDRKDLVSVVRTDQLEKPNPLSFSAEHLWAGPNVIEIPAAPGKEPIYVLARPAYFLVDHGGINDSYAADDNLVSERAKPTIYAVYLIGIGAGEEKEMRLISFPAALFPGQNNYNAALLKEVKKQGISEEAARRALDLNEVEITFSYLEARELTTMRFLMAGRQFKTESPDPESPKRILKSGWATVGVVGRQHGEYVFIGAPERITRTPGDIYFNGEGIYWYLEHQSYHERNMGVNPISEPYDAKRASAFDVALYQKIIDLNKA